MNWPIFFISVKRKSQESAWAEWTDKKSFHSFLAETEFCILSKFFSLLLNATSFCRLVFQRNEETDCNKFDTNLCNFQKGFMNTFNSKL